MGTIAPADGSPPGVAGRRFTRRRVAVALLLLIGIVFYLSLPRWVANAIVAAPNRGKVIESVGPAPKDIDRILRITVGPPPATLSVWMMDPRDYGPSEPRGAVLLLHGIRDSKSSLRHLAYTLSREGFRAALLDLRGHGESTGDWLTYGVVESQDVVQVLDYLARAGLLAGPVGIYGASFGAATAIQAAARDTRIRAVVAVAPFSSMQEVVPISIRAFLPGGRLLTDAWIAGTIERAGVLAGFHPEAASPLAAIATTDARVLLIHGRKDAKIPCAQSEALHAAAPDRTRLILLDNEDHDSIMRDATGTISRDGIAWLRQWLVAEPSEGGPNADAVTSRPRGL